jgi:predicted alpha-1,2-mannosidase
MRDRPDPLPLPTPFPAFVLWLVLGVASGAAAGPPTRHVDPLIGTDGTGHVFPGASVPFGMVQPSPDNADAGWSYAGGYQYRAPRMLGFSNTHISGAGIPELGDVLLMPAAGLAWSEATTDFSAAPDKATERARAGHYTVALPAHGVRVELTATARVAVHRYTFTRGGEVQVLVDLQHGLRFGEGPRVLEAASRVDAARGEVSGTARFSNWVERDLGFVVRFDRPVKRVITLPPRAGERAARYVLNFAPWPGRVLHARVAVSTIDDEGARRNLATAANRPFDTVRADADRAWNALLSRVEIEGDERLQRLFHSALYRTLLHPSDIADADGRVRGPRGRVIQAPRDAAGSAGRARWDSTLSLWDTFRAVHPLHTLLFPERVPGTVNTMLAHEAEQGYLPLWTAWGRETHTMIGNPALPVIADAVVKGFGGFDHRQALAAMVRSSTQDRPQAPAWAQRSWATYERFGFLPYDLEAGESVSKTLEHGIGDTAVARVAAALGEHDVARRFAQRAQGWRHLYDPETRTMRGRSSAGGWRTPFDPLLATSPMNNPGDYTEANAWQYTPTPALHDVAGFVERLGGPAALEAWLDRFFTLPGHAPDKHLGQEAMVGQYAHGNEPGHHVAWLYAFTPSPGKGHVMVERLVRSFYGDTPAGIVGNDDAGQMSAWLVFAVLGFYPVDPSGGTYVAGRPLVPRAVLRLPQGRRLVIERGGGAGVTLDGRPLPPTAIPHAALVRGGRLVIGAGSP